MNVALRVVLGLMGLAIELAVFDAAIRTFLLPRVAHVRLSRVASLVVGSIFRVVATRKSSYLLRDQVLSLYASLVLLAYQALWLGLSFLAFTLGFEAFGAPSFAAALQFSGASITTLGSSRPEGAGLATLGYLEAGVGLLLLALLIAFIPTLYAAFQRRELSVSRMSVRAGIPATPWGVLELAHSVKSYARLEGLWQEWEQWFIEVGETHTTLTILNYYRSPDPNQTWIGAAATVLDSAALFNAVVDEPPSASAGLCVRSGWLTLRRLANYFHVDYPTTFDETTPITITRDEFDLVLARLTRAGVPLVADHDVAWRDFVGWRVNYDAIIEAFYGLFNYPRTEWQSAVAQPLFEPSNVRGGAVTRYKRERGVRLHPEAVEESGPAPS